MEPEHTFEALIVPHRSLSPAGTRWLAGAVVAASFGVSAWLWVLGAWPVLGFNGAEVTLALLLLRQNNRARRTSEVLRLSGHELSIVRTDARGRRRELALPPFWLRCFLQERPGRVPALWLAAGRRRYEVGAALNEAEKRSLHAALGRALHRLHHPIFDNPQLRS